MSYITDPADNTMIIKAGDYPVHRAANIVPLDKSFDVLKNSIKRSGLIDAITLYKGEILDGRRRAISCKELSIPVREDELFDLNGEMTEKELYEVVMAKNTRRNLSKAQMAMVAAIECHNKSHIRMGIPRAVDYAYKIWGVSKVTYDKARFILINDRIFANEIFSTGFATINGQRTSMSQTYDYLKKPQKNMETTGYDKGDPELAELFSDMNKYVDFLKTKHSNDQIKFVFQEMSNKL